MQVNAVGRLSDPAQFGDIVVRAAPNRGAVVHLRDVARIELGALQYASSAFLDDKPTIVLGVFQMPGSNALDLQQHVQDKMVELAKRFPKGIDYAMRYDTTRFVSASMHDVLFTLRRPCSSSSPWCSSSCKAGAPPSSRASPSRSRSSRRWS